MKRMARLAFSMVVLGVFAAGSIAHAQIPKIISYQGILTDGAGVIVPDASYSVTFKLYTVATGGSSLWSETQSVSTSKGVFNVMLGSVTPITYGFDKACWLGAAVGAGSEMTPRVQLAAGPYSMRSGWADTAGFLKASFGATGSVSSATPLGNGPGWIFIAPDGSRHDFYVGSTATVIDYKLYVNHDGNVGVGTYSWPGGKLGVQGDIFVSGNLTKEYSSGTRNNATPVAFGTVNSTGAITTATPNVSCTWNGTDKWYEITITSVNYFWGDYVTLVTVVPPTGPPVIASSGSVSNKLLIVLQNTSGTNIQSNFSFVTYKP